MDGAGAEERMEIRYRSNISQIKMRGKRVSREPGSGERETVP